MEGAVAETLYCAGVKLPCVRVAALSTVHIVVVILITAVLIWPPTIMYNLMFLVSW